MYRILPRPPIGVENDSTIEEWIHACYEVGGIEAINWLWDPANWPLSATARGRMFHVTGQLRRDDERRQKEMAEAKAKTMAMNRAIDRHERRKAAGWA
jgi:hypothetical protein